MLPLRSATMRCQQPMVSFFRPNCVRLAEKFDRKGKPHLNIGTIGHVDHGKTTLTSAITHHLAKQGLADAQKYEDIDKAPEELKRGITINATHVEYSTTARHYAHIDCPGHADYVKNMITGVSAMDGAILVVAATHGTMPQTKEHVLLCKQVGIKNLAVFVNKCDSGEVDDEIAELVEEEIKDLLEEHEFDTDKIPFVRGSAREALAGNEQWMPKIQELMDAVDKRFELPERPDDKPFLMAIESVFAIKGRGTVVTGRTERGTLKPGDQVDMVGYGPTVGPINVASIEMFHKTLDKCVSGDNVGILVKGVAKNDARRGMVVTAHKSVNGYSKFRCQLYVLTPQEGGRPSGFFENYSPTFFCRSADISGRIYLPEHEGMDKFDIENLGDQKGMLSPGDHAEVSVQFQFPVPLHVGQRMAVREGGRSIGAAVVTAVDEGSVAPTRRPGKK